MAIKFAETYRNATTVFVTVGLLLLLVWGLFQEKTAPVLIERKNINAVVMDISVNQKEDMPASVVMRFKLPNDKTCKVFITSKAYPKKGDSVSIILERYDDNTMRCVVDRQTLLINQFK